jgi:hypothetical protein
MAKPPANADPMLFIIGKGLYTNDNPWRTIGDSETVRIEPAPMPVASIVTHNIVFVAFFYGFHLLFKYSAQHMGPIGKDIGPMMLYVAPFGIGLLTCTLYTLFTIHIYRTAQVQGNWLIYDKRTGQVELPRDGVSFHREEIVHLQYITTKRLDWGGVVNNDKLSELNLITLRDGQRQRWHLLRSIITHKAFDDVLRPLVEHTTLPVMRVTDQWLGWEVTQRPWTA